MLPERCERRIQRTHCKRNR